jgi:dTDP-4-amino-4,6-dideoxygalactose transaminase
MNNLNAALGLSQLERCDKNVAIRKQNYNFLKSNMPSELGRFTNHDESSSYYLSSFILNDGYFSDKMREDLLASGIQTSFHYPFLHTSSFYKDESSLPKVEGFSNRIINLPIHQELSNKDKEKIVDECIRYSRSRSKS